MVNLNATESKIILDYPLGYVLVTNNYHTSISKHARVDTMLNLDRIIVLISIIKLDSLENGIVDGGGSICLSLTHRLNGFNGSFFVFKSMFDGTHLKKWLILNNIFCLLMVHLSRATISNHILHWNSLYLKYPLNALSGGRITEKVRAPSGETRIGADCRSGGETSKFISNRNQTENEIKYEPYSWK